MIAVTSSTLVLVVGALGLASLVPVVWAIVDVARRPVWQFSTGRKVLWATTLAIGWLLLWPLALVSSIVYLAVLRRRFPPAAAGPRDSMYGRHYGPHGPFGGSGVYGGQGPYPSHGPYGGHGGTAGQAPSGQGPSGQGAAPYDYQPPPSSLPPAGWYPDPAGSAQERWWDGRGWSHHLR